MKSPLIFSVVIAFIFCAWVVQSQKSINKITDDRAIQAIVGEYATEDIYGMKLIAHAIRNRGTLKGVYGINANHNKNENKDTWVLASIAWFESAKEKDTTGGASEWRSDQDLAKYGFPKGFTLTVAHGGIWFFKKQHKHGGIK